jgi:hypothetical protein
MSKQQIQIDETLRKIGRTEPSPFLLTRIEAQIESDQLPIFLRPRLIAVAAVLLVLINVGVLGTAELSENNKYSTEVLETMDINRSNQLYYE